MGLYSLLRGIANRFKMACLYPDQVICLAEGIAEGVEISDAIKAKWKAESDRQVQGLMDQKERELSRPSRRMKRGWSHWRRSETPS